MNLADGWFDEFLAQSGIQPHQACWVALLIFRSKFLLKEGRASFWQKFMLHLSNTDVLVIPASFGGLTVGALIELA